MHVGDPRGRNFAKMLEIPDFFGSFDVDACAYGSEEVACSQIGNRRGGRCFFAENV